ncbi:helix-turn-helix domain-containing protein [Curtobacterium sp. BRD11]|uniref:helix-turn-helix domain-containing protein n=1 Tax=Curtobacterium sp. BRD11 TaxID=2962581 RepID=UPI0028828C43|nr:helix-turn-helix domain-containing protein [Curtobacterium sp. BRD11]MDT0212079.1 helix-turn-helix domain-containing protein [Curtobacterium sp. BRD11]
MGTLGELIRETRERLGLEQTELARRVEVGQQAVSTWERDAGRPRRSKIERLADVLGLAAEDLLVAGGYEQPSGPPVTPLLPVLPFDQLSDATFERFCRDLWAYRYPQASVSRNGDSGYAQGGVDVIVRLPELTIGVQCKRHRDFGAAAVQAAIEDAASNEQIDRGVIALSRPLATPAARARAAAYSEWVLEDGEDLSKAVRGLRDDQKLQLVDSYFPGYRAPFLGIQAPSPWLSESANEPFLAGRAGYERDFDLVGRDDELQALTTFADEGRQIIVLTGGPGSGKTRLLTELARRSASHNVVFAARGPISSQDMEALPSSPTVIVDDAGDRDSDLRALLDGIVRARSDAQIILGFRPHHEERIRGAVGRGFLWQDLPRIDLPPLSIDAARALATAALGPETSSRTVRALALNGRDCPLLIVIGSHLIREGRLNPESMGTSQELRVQVLDLYATSLIGDGGSIASQPLLEAIAAIQPIRTDDSHFIETLASLLNSPQHEIARAIDGLEFAGLLLRRGESVRVVPDMLGDALLEQSLVTASGRSTGYSKSLAAAATNAPLRNALRNVAIAEWVARQDRADLDLAEDLWTAITSVALAASSNERIALAHDLEYVAGTRPALALELAEQILANPAPVEQSPYADFFDHDTSTGPAQVERALTRLIRNSADFERLPRAMRLLWQIGKQDGRPENQNPEHGLRLLRELGAFDLEKRYALTDLYVKTIASWLDEEGTSPAERATLIGLLMPALDREGMSEGFEGSLTMTFTRFRVPIEDVLSIRSAVISIVRGQLREHPAVAAAAIKVLEHALQGAGAEIDDEFALVSDVLGRTMNDSAVSAGTRLAAFRALSWHATYGEGATRSRARDLRSTFKVDLDIQVIRLLRSGWAVDEDDEEEGRYTIAASEKKIAATAHALLAKQGSDEEVVQAILEAIRAEIAEQGHFVLPGYFITLLCDERGTLASVILGDAIEHDPDDLAWRSLVLPALGHLLKSQPDRGLAAADALLAKDVRWSSIVAGSVCGDHGGQASELELDLVHRLLALSDEDTELALVSGIRWYGSDSETLAFEIVANAKVDVFKSVAHVVAQLLAYGAENIHWDHLPAPTQAMLINKLGATPDISDYSVQKLLTLAVTGREEEVLRMLRSRVEKAIDREKGYQALPYHWDEGPNFRAAPNYPVLVRDLATWMSKVPRGISSWWAPKLFALVAGPWDDEIQQLVLSLVRDGTDAAIRAAAAALDEAPQEYGMQQPAFAAELLDAARAVSRDAEGRIAGALYAATMFGMRSRSIGDFGVDLGRASRAQELATSFADGSPSRQFYLRIAAASERNAEQDRQQDEDFEDPRRW